MPLDHKLPSIVDGPRLPVTRSRPTADALGILIFVFSPEPMLNVFQFMTAFCELCVTVTVDVPCPWMVALPPATCPPSGLATASHVPSGIRAVVARRSRR